MIEKEIERRLERQERKDLKDKKEVEREERYEDLPAHFLEKLYK
jgi:hypothetical protein